MFDAGRGQRAANDARHPRTCVRVGAWLRVGAWVHVGARVRVCACARACVRACVRACIDEQLNLWLASECETLIGSSASREPSIRHTALNIVPRSDIQLKI